VSHLAIYIYTAVTDYIPYDVRCMVSTINDSHHVFNVSWKISPDLNDVRSFKVSLECPKAGYKAEEKV